MKKMFLAAVLLLAPVTALQAADLQTNREEMQQAVESGKKVAVYLRDGFSNIGTLIKSDSDTYSMRIEGNGGNVVFIPLIVENVREIRELKPIRHVPSRRSGGIATDF